MTYTELQVTSSFSFLRGASQPDELVEEAAGYGYEAIAITECRMALEALCAVKAAQRITDDEAARLRAAGVPVLEGTRTGLLALRHLLEHASPPEPPPLADPPGPAADRWRHDPPTGGAALFALLREYGIQAVQAVPAVTRAAALTAADQVGYPVVLKTDAPQIAHKSDVGGVRLGLRGPAEVTAAYDDLAARLGPRVLVCAQAAPGPELALGIVRDPNLGPLIVIGAGGLLVEIMAERAVLLAPLTPASALAALRSLRVFPALAGARSQPAADLDAVASAIAALSRLACDLGDVIDALDINPLICHPTGLLAVDALLVPRQPRPASAAVVR